MTNIISIYNLSKAFDGKKLFQNFNFTVKKNSVPVSYTHLLFASFLFEFSICIIPYVRNKINNNLQNGENTTKMLLNHLRNVDILSLIHIWQRK